jgi:Uma2 family endonuclease
MDDADMVRRATRPRRARGTNPGMADSRAWGDGLRRLQGLWPRGVIATISVDFLLSIGSTAMPLKTYSSTVSATQELLDDLVLALLPQQGEWSQETYLWLSEQGNRLIEFTDGYIEVLPMPTDEHQTILAYLYQVFFGFLQRLGGKVLFAPLRLRIRERKFREPDMLLVRHADDPRRQNRFWLGADLVVEIVSPDKPERDLVEKRNDYAEAHIPEYWIVDPRDETITILRLEQDTYVEHGLFRRGSQASSVLLDGLTVQVDAVFDAE